ncbi:hypothetical protein C0Q70_16297 [Pomacea canaliculata]|uniref:Uncharacterized protein n=1 Tax=Pomacea canaliculata TaxID=400727 RepID=A0A2T7NPD2_POMCA|nr:ras-related protein Rab-13-like [Pomacea canaliculata]XP_025110813.1 ras-related protein Rab-13-like [Pomacea canaliculata]PVD23035.1 hypothetical protein C0Q70_16297 [Pomacea canaliculata]
MPLEEKDCAATYKILILGENSVGKTAILNSLVGRDFKSSVLPTSGVDFVKKIFEVDGALVQLVIWDTAGQERFRSITRLQYKGTQGIILVYDITNPDSFSRLTYWMDSIQKEIKHKHSAYEPIPIVLCGNKSDMEDQRKVETYKGEKFANQQMAFEFFETSAKCGLNIFQAFQRLAYHVTDICNPRLMKSYHPFMIRQRSNKGPLSRRSANYKRKTKNEKTKGKESVIFCCVQASDS